MLIFCLPVRLSVTNVFGLSKERQGNNVAKRVANIMRGLGWNKPEGPIRIGKLVCRGFIRRVGGADEV